MHFFSDPENPVTAFNKVKFTITPVNEVFLQNYALKYTHGSEIKIAFLSPYDCSTCFWN